MNTLENTFHDTSARVRDAARALDILAAIPHTLTPAERRYAARIRAKLCGSPTCTCGTVRAS